MAVPTGINQGIASILGMPMDTAANIVDLVKAGLGYTQSKVTGQAPSEAFDPYDRSQVPLSSEWIAKQANKAGIQTEAPRPDDTASRFIHATAAGVPGAMVGGGGSTANVTRQLTAGAASGAAAQTAAELGADPGTQAAAALAVGAGAGAARSPKGKTAVTPEPQAPATTPVEVARAAGYKLKPSEAGGKVGKVAEGLSGAAKLERDLVGANQTVTHKLVAEEIGLPADTQRFTPSVLNQAKAPHNAVYDEVGTKLGDWNASPDFLNDLGGALPTRGSTQKVKEQVGNLIEQFSRPTWNGKDAIQEVRKLRASSTKRIRSDDPDVQSFGYAERRVADAIEDEMTRQAEFIGEPNLMQRLAAARESLAKIHTVDAARTGTEVSAVKLAAQAKKGKPLSGRLKLVADVGAEFPTVMRTTAGMKDKTPVNMTETAAGGILSAMGHNLTAGATFVARPATRAALTSDWYQNRFGPVAQQLGPNSPLGAYFSAKAPRTEAAPIQPRSLGPSVEFEPSGAQAGAASPEAMLRAQQLSGKLELQPEPVANGVELPPAATRLGDLVAESPPPVRGDLPFTPSQPLAATLADDLGLTPDFRGEGLTLTPSQPRAVGMADNVPGTTLYPELRAVRDRPFTPESPITLADELAPEWRAREADRIGEKFEAERATAAKEAAGSYEVQPGRREDIVIERPREEARRLKAAAMKGDVVPPRNKAPGTIELKGDEFGDKDLSMFDLKSKAREIARKQFADTTVTNLSDGSQIKIPWSGIKHSLAGKSTRNKVLAFAKLDELIENGVLTAIETDRYGRSNVKAFYNYETPVVVDGTPTAMRVVVREAPDGRRYYDHLELSPEKESPAQGGAPTGNLAPFRTDDRSGNESLQPIRGGEAAAGENITTGGGEHIELAGDSVSRRKAGIEHIGAEARRKTPRKRP